MTELKPCPFCGGDADMLDIGGVYFVACQSQRCLTHPRTSYNGNSIQSMMEWNTRDTSYYDRVIEAVKSQYESSPHSDTTYGVNIGLERAIEAIKALRGER